ncbi:TniQ family protein [Streptomyces sp. NPDC051742]|uniref:TniQ family protein n=1 Tax=unclassified Streptomyces TaxID=2593676 RepID=UPI003422AFC1
MSDRRRPLARSLSPLPEESLSGFLLRLSHRLDRPPLRIAQRLGLTTRHHRLPYAHLHSLPDDLVLPFAAMTHLTAQETQALTLRRFSTTYPDLLTIRAGTHRARGPATVGWNMTPSSRYCPPCLILQP